MELNKLVKIVYEDNTEVKVLRGILRGEDEFTYTLEIDVSKTVVIGKRNLIKATYDDKQMVG